MIISMHTNHVSILTKLTGLMLLASAPFQAHATLTYENVNGVGLIYDSTDSTTWTQDADVAGQQTFDFEDAQKWAASLDYAGIAAPGWQLPDVAQFMSLFAQLDGTYFKYGAQVDFGTGPNDYVTNVSPEYWTDTSGNDFNFYYGYGGGRPNSADFSVWAVERVPDEASVLSYGLSAFALAGCKRLFRRK
jgi:hypothetical protein